MERTKELGGNEMAEDEKHGCGDFVCSLEIARAG